MLTLPTQAFVYNTALKMLKLLMLSTESLVCSTALTTADFYCCSCDVAATSDIIWEGYMGANKAAFLFGKVLNLEPAAEPRKQQLSTGMFLLQDVRCRTCSTPFGWSYLKAWSQASPHKTSSLTSPC